MILPLFGRLRNANVAYTPRMLWATNPAFNHGIYHWIKDFYLDHEGIPLKDKSNVERYFVLHNNKPAWFNSRAEAEEIYGKGTDNGIQSFRSIRAHVTDNIPLLKAQPGYLSNLKSLPEIKRKIFFDGSWISREEEAGYYKRTFSEIVPYPSITAIKRVRSWDTSSTPPSSASPDPDHTRGCLISKDKQGYITLEDIVSMRDRPHKVEELIVSTAVSDPEGTIVVLNVDPGSAGLAYVDHIRKRLADLGIYCRVIRSNKGKLQRFLPFSAIAEAGYTRVVKADWNEDWFEEAERFNGKPNNGHDDMCDAVALGVEALSQSINLPTFSLPDLTSTPSFGYQQINLPTNTNVVQIGEFTT